MNVLGQAINLGQPLLIQTTESVNMTFPSRLDYQPLFRETRLERVAEIEPTFQVACDCCKRKFYQVELRFFSTLQIFLWSNTNSYFL